MITTAGHGLAGIGVTNIGFHTSRGLGGRVNAVGTGTLGTGRRSTGLASGRVSHQLAGCFTAHPFVAQGSFRDIYNVVHAATVQRVHQLHARKGLGGRKAVLRPVCMPISKCCNGGR